MPTFTAGELEVMRILWKHGELKPAEIQQHFHREIKNPALRSYLSILLDKGHVTRRRQGRAYYYRAATQRESTMHSMLSELVHTCCDGSTEALLCHLIRSERLSEKELLQLKHLAEGESPRPVAEEPEKGSQP